MLEAYRHKILSLRQQADVRNEWLKYRLDHVLPELMKREGFDMWLVIAREYNEDPVIMTLLPQPAMSARRRTILVFYRQPDGVVERLTVSRYDMPGFYQSVWNPDDEPDQYDALARVIQERNPHTIGINISDTFAFGDGLTHSQHTYLFALDKNGDLRHKMKSAERLAVAWLETRTPAEIMVYPGIVEIGHALIAEAFSTRVIQPGITTTDDVVWWMREKMQSMGLAAWFQPTVEIQAQDNPFTAINIKDAGRKVILPGDLLHCDVGFYYLGLATDQQQHAYVLKAGEKDAPQGLKDALAEGNRLQDILMHNMRIGRTGNEILADTLAHAKAEGINPCVYSHPLGYHGHAAGPTIGLWDNQVRVGGSGDYEVHDNTAYSIELNIIKPVAEWGGQEVRIMLEEDAVLQNGVMRWLHGRQTALHLIG
ncbi:MAG: Xaa-Pro aminopeptidase [Phototrophicales bacterium]|nr:MAG: Xaa-Pro aminopeptidase [Phototrophicales bacterium]